MNRKVYIDGNVLIKSGVFYARDFVMYASEHYKNGAEIIKCGNDGAFEVKEDYGSMFIDYYTSGGLTLLGGNGIFFKYTHKEAYCQYKDNITTIQSMLKTKIPEDLEHFFLQQQYISVVGALERFLYNILMRCTCDNQLIYKRLIDSRFKILAPKDDSIARKVLCGKNCLEKEKMFIKQVQKIVYHNQEKVTPLFKTAFGIDPCLGQLKSEIAIRHDLVHRMGYTLNNILVTISREEVYSLIDKVNSIVENIKSNIQLQESKYQYNK